MKKFVRTTTVSVVLLLFLIFSLKTLLFTANATERTFTWTDSCFGVIVGINLVTETPWTTNNTHLITFSFTVQRLSGFANYTFYNNNHIKLKEVELDPCANVYASLFKNLTEGQTWTTTWNFTPKATDLELSSRGIRWGKSVILPLSLQVGFTVVDLDGNGRERRFQSDEATITVIGGPDASGDGAIPTTFLVIFMLIGIIAVVVTVVALRYPMKQCEVRRYIRSRRQN